LLLEISQPVGYDKNSVVDLFSSVAYFYQSAVVRNEGVRWTSTQQFVNKVIILNKNSILKFTVVILYHSKNDQVKEDEMGRVCSTNAGEEECI
jgi:hypothetical protein